MLPDPLSDEDDQYASSEDSDFAPDAVPGHDHVPDQSDAEDENNPSSKRSRPDEDTKADDAGYDNSGDEAIIKRGEKRRRKTGKGAREEDEGGEGGLIKTRRQRAAE